MPGGGDDQRWMQAAIALAARSRGLSTPNPNVGCLIVKDGRVLARGWTQAGGRPHAEAIALDAAGNAARGATAYVTLEPCAHESPRGPACADLLIAAGVARVVAAVRDPDARTDGQGLARLAAAGVTVSDGVGRLAAMEAMAGWWTRATRGRAHVTLKLATSLDGCIALASGESRWITGDRARALTHLFRARSDAILVGRGTWERDRPGLDVRLSGLESRSPRRLVLSASGVSDAECAPSPEAAAAIDGINDLFVEGGAQTAAAFLKADLVDTLLLHRAPILIGGGKAALTDIGLGALDQAHGRWALADARQLGSDRVEHYQRVRKD